MKRFSEINIGDEFYSECEITLQELDSYLSFSGIKNVIYENNLNTIFSFKEMCSLSSSDIQLFL